MSLRPGHGASPNPHGKHGFDKVASQSCEVEGFMDADNLFPMEGCAHEVA